MDDDASTETPPAATANTNGTGGSQQGANPAPTGNLNAPIPRTDDDDIKDILVTVCVGMHEMTWVTMLNKVIGLTAQQIIHLREGDYKASYDMTWSTSKTLLDWCDHAGMILSPRARSQLMAL